MKLALFRTIHGTVSLYVQNVTFLMPAFFEWMKGFDHSTSPVPHEHEDTSDPASDNSGT